MNQRTAIDRRAKEWLTAEEATARLGIKRQTLYAYASRRLIRTAPASAEGRERVYQVEDVERLRTRSRARSGHGAVAAAALHWGEPVLETRIGEIREDGPYYRGRAAVTLAGEGAAFEDVCELLCDCSFPVELAHDEQTLGIPHGPLRALLRADAEPFDGMLLAAAALAALDKVPEASIEIAKVRAPLLVRRLIAALGLAGKATALEASLAAEGAARALLRALGAKTTPSNIAAINEALVLSAEHELNASTFAARVAASVETSLAATVLAALAVQSGPLHGAAAARVEAFAETIAKPEDAIAVVGARLSRGESIPGFGHPLYPKGDPRGSHLLAAAQRLNGRAKTVRVLSSLVDAMRLVAREPPTIDVGLVAIAAALNLPPGAPLAIFAAGRLAGLIAHTLEQRASGDRLRPRARYVGG